MLLGQIEKNVSSSYVGNYLLKERLIAEEDLHKAAAYIERFGGGIGSVLIRLGAISEDTLLRALSVLFQLAIVEPTTLPLMPGAFIELIERSKIEVDWWLDQEIVAWQADDGSICYVSTVPLAESVVEILSKAFPETMITPCLARSYEIDRILESISQGNSSVNFASSLDQLRELAEEAPVIEFVNNLMTQAYEQRASDVHIEPGEHKLEVRFRIDGVLHNRFELPRQRFAAIASRVKLISGIDIAERRLPQDGRVGLRMSGEHVDLRVSTIPGVHGESIVLRLLPKEDRGFKVAGLGLEPDHGEMFSRWIKEPHGIILVTGPTGSGKSTTLYAALEEINDRKKKIITVEDPVEFYLNGVTQIQTHAEIGYTFARALRSIMRQDPDVVMIGEIRDKETAEIAIQASLTGHLVVSTLHTNNSISSFTRLIDMGVEPFLVATPIRAIMAQRLVRKLCAACAQAFEPVADIQQQLAAILPDHLHGQEGANWRKATGCPECQGTGYKGRIGIYELVEMTPELQHLILTSGSENEMWRQAEKQKSFRTLRQDGFLKAWQGVTSVEEVLRITSGR